MGHKMASVARYNLIQGRREGGQGRVEPFGFRENAVGTRHMQQVGPIHPGGASRTVEMYPAFWTGGLILLQLAVHPAHVSKGSPVQVAIHHVWNPYPSLSGKIPSVKHPPLPGGVQALLKEWRWNLGA